MNTTMISPSSIWNSLCRQRRTIQWVLVAILLTSWHRSQARSQPRPALLAAALWRLLPASDYEDVQQQQQQQQHQSNESSATTTTVCPDRSVVVAGGTATSASSSSPPLLNDHLVQQHRGGYRDEAAVAAADAAAVTVAVEKKKQQQKNNKNNNNKTADQQKQKQQQQQPYIFSLFQPGDGHETNVDGIPQRYIQMHNGQIALAKESLASTIAWRNQHEIDSLLQRPHKLYDVCKAVFPHYFAGRDVNQHVVFVQRPGLLSMELAKANDLSKEALLQHYVYVNEYLWQVVEAASPLGTMLGIIDLQGINLKTLRQGDILAFLKIFVKTMDNHYPQRAHKTLIINTPKWFNIIYKLVGPLLRESTKEKIEIWSRGKKQDAALYGRLGGEAVAHGILPESFFSKYNAKKKKKNRHHHQHRNKQQQQQQQDEEEEHLSDADTTSLVAIDDTTSLVVADDDDEEALPLDAAVLQPQQLQLSEIELQLRQFVLDRLQEVGETMTPVVQAK